MRIVVAKGQHFGYRVMIGQMVPDSLFGINAEGPNAVQKEIVRNWADVIHNRLGGQAYSEKEAKSLQQDWCFGSTTILEDRTHYFGFVKDEDAVWFKLIAETNG